MDGFKITVLICVILIGVLIGAIILSFKDAKKQDLECRAFSQQFLDCVKAQNCKGEFFYSYQKKCLTDKTTTMIIPIFMPMGR